MGAPLQGRSGSVETCNDCDEMMTRATFRTEGMTDAAKHIAEGIAHGGGACDHVEYEDADIALAYAELYSREMRYRDILRDGINRLERDVVHEWGIGPSADFIVSRAAAIFERAGLAR